MSRSTRYVWQSCAWMSRATVLLTLVLGVACDDDTTVTGPSGPPRFPLGIGAKWQYDGTATVATDDNPGGIKWTYERTDRITTPVVLKGREWGVRESQIDDRVSQILFAQDSSLVFFAFPEDTTSSPSSAISQLRRATMPWKLLKYGQTASDTISLFEADTTTWRDNWREESNVLITHPRGSLEVPAGRFQDVYHVEYRRESLEWNSSETWARGDDRTFHFYVDERIGVVKEIMYYSGFETLMGGWSGSRIAELVSYDLGDWF